jgi:sporulation protein YlmC with PRC-barrel domain
MIRNLLATTALATLVSTGVYAQDATQPAQPAAPATTTTETAPAAPVVQADGFLASDLIGETVYNGTGDDAEKIGDVNDIVLAAGGEVEAVIIGVGGFLGIGEKDVAVNFEEIEWADRDGDRWMVVAATKDQLKEQPAFDRTPYEPAQAPVAATDPNMPADQSTAEAPADTSQTATETAEAPADSTQTTTETAEVPAAPADSAETTTETAEAPAAPADSTETTTETAEAPAAADSSETTTETAEAPAAADSSQSTTETVQVPIAPADSDDSSTDTAQDTTQPADSGTATTDTTTTAAIDRSTLTEMPTDDIRAEELVGTTVYGANDETIGEIGDIVLTSDGKIDAYVIDVGGFLGMGEKEVAIGSDNLSFMADKDGNKYLYTTFTKEQLEAVPTYDESSWAEKRDEQRLTVTQ